jgi:hypothetical protein
MMLIVTFHGAWCCYHYYIKSCCSGLLSGARDAERQLTSSKCRHDCRLPRGPVMVHVVVGLYGFVCLCHLMVHLHKGGSRGLYWYGVRSGADNACLSIPRLCDYVALPGPGDSAGANINNWSSNTQMFIY